MRLAPRPFAKGIHAGAHRPDTAWSKPGTRRRHNRMWPCRGAVRLSPCTVSVPRPVPPCFVETGPSSRFPIDGKRSVPFYGTDLLLASRPHIGRDYCVAIKSNVTRPGPCPRLRWLRRAPCRGPPEIRRTRRTPCRCFRCRTGVPRTSCSRW